MSTTVNTTTSSALPPLFSLRIPKYYPPCCGVVYIPHPVRAPAAPAVPPVPAAPHAPSPSPAAPAVAAAPAAPCVAAAPSPVAKGGSSVARAIARLQAPAPAPPPRAVPALADDLRVFSATLAFQQLPSGPVKAPATGAALAAAAAITEANQWKVVADPTKRDKWLPVPKSTAEPPAKPTATKPVEHAGGTRTPALAKPAVLSSEERELAEAKAGAAKAAAVKRATRGYFETQRKVRLAALRAELGGCHGQGNPAASPPATPARSSRPSPVTPPAPERQVTKKRRGRGVKKFLKKLLSFGKCKPRTGKAKTSKASTTCTPDRELTAWNEMLGGEQKRKSKSRTRCDGRGKGDCKWAAPRCSCRNVLFRRL